MPPLTVTGVVLLAWEPASMPPEIVRSATLDKLLILELVLKETAMPLNGIDASSALVGGDPSDHFEPSAQSPLTAASQLFGAAEDWRAHSVPITQMPIATQALIRFPVAPLVAGG